jgi:hypothetical protein
MSMSLDHAQDHAPAHIPAIVARPAVRSDEHESYLLLTPLGQPTWTADPQVATAFDSMREAARAAFRLPANVRAFGLPRSVELSLSRAH